MQFTTFERFLNDVLQIDERYNRHYLRAEYNFAHSSAQMAAKWEEFEKHGDRYLLQYRTANDGKVRPAHAALHNVTLEKNDPFWEEFLPPNGWNCRCTVVEVRRSKYVQTPHDEAMELGEEATRDDRRRMFRWNSGKTGKTFPDYNPYTIKQCRDCDFGKLGHVAQNELCAACRKVRETYNKNENLHPINAYDNLPELKGLRKSALREVKAKGGKILSSKKLYTGRMKMAKKEYECVVAHAYYADEVAAFRLLPEIIEKLNNGYYIPLDISRPNIKKKIDSKVLHFVGYDVVINGIEYVLKCMAKRDDKNKHGTMIEYPYSFKKKRTSE